MFPDISIEALRDQAEDGNTDSRFLLGQVCLQRNELDNPLRWLRAAATIGLPNAVEALGQLTGRDEMVPPAADALHELLKRSQPSRILARM